MGEGPNGKNDKVILFPGLHKRVYELGMDALNQKKYKEAIDYFEELSTLDQKLYDTSEVQVGMIISLFELGQLQDAKKVCKRLLKEDIGDYFDILQIYASILIQLGEYNEVVDIIEAVLQESKFPPQHAEQLYQLLEFSRKQMKQKQAPLKNDLAQEKELVAQKLDQLKKATVQSKQIQILQDLKGIDMSQHLDMIQGILQSKAIHPFIKTFVLQMLLEDGVDRKVTLEKFNKTYEVIPVDLKEPLNQDFARDVKKILEDQLESENPTLYEVVKQLWENFMIITYPFPPQPADPQIWAAGLHIVGYQFQGIDVFEEEIVEKYDIDDREIKAVIDQIKNVDASF